MFWKKENLSNIIIFHKVVDIIDFTPVIFTHLALLFELFLGDSEEYLAE